MQRAAALRRIRARHRGSAASEPVAGTLSLTRLPFTEVPLRLKRQVGDKPGDVYTGVLELVIRDIQQVIV